MSCCIRLLRLLEESNLPDERTIAMVFLPLRPKALGETLAYFFKDTCMWND